MSNILINRRKFIQKTLAAGVTLTGLSAFKQGTGYDPKGLPTVVLGQTGVRVPRIGIGLGSRFCSVADEDESLAILTNALDNGIYYWDTANSYLNSNNGVISEERIGKVLRSRRNEVFLSTKIAARDAGEAMRQLETSLGRLQTDFLDNLMIHNVSSAEDVEKLSERGGVIELVSRLKEQGVTRFTGFSGHSNAGAKRLMIERGDFDTVLFAMDQYENYSQNREEIVIPAALDRGMGILLMKVVRPKETVAGFTASELIRFALTLEGPTGLILGMDSVEVVRSNAALLKSFVPMTPEEMSAMASVLSPFFNGSKFEWTMPGYNDGYWG